jgi:hypothetical protein
MRLATLLLFFVIHAAADNQFSTIALTAATQANIEHNLRKWQERLNLKDWVITIFMVRQGELKPKTLGHIRWDSDKKTAVIRVLDPLDYELPLHEALQDIGFTIVHELIHLELAPVLSPLQRNDANRREEEHAVNHIAGALLKLDANSKK